MVARAAGFSVPGLFGAPKIGSPFGSSTLLGLPLGAASWALFGSPWGVVRFFDRFVGAFPGFSGQLPEAFWHYFEKN